MIKAAYDLDDGIGFIRPVASERDEVAMSGGTGMQLHDRAAERAVLDRLVEATEAGHSQVLVLRGEAGVGKTALLDYAVQRASRCHVVQVTGAESEMELPFAGLHQLCAPMLDRRDSIPAPQRDALAIAFGLRAGEPPDRFLVGLAVLSLLSELAAEQPLLCVVDDAQWLDWSSAQTLEFVARRLLAEQLAMVFAVRDSGTERKFPGLPELMVDGLRATDARVLLESVVTGRLDERVRDRIVAEARGNPLALLELPRTSTTLHLAGGFALPQSAPLASRIEQSFLDRQRELPEETQQLLLVAAAEPLGDVPLLLRAVGGLGIGPDAAEPARAAGLLEFGARVLFRHPLVRSAIYRAARAEQRRQAHRLLAEATDPDADPDRRAWHRAHAADGPDGAVADELEDSAERAASRGGLAAAAAFLERAVQSTPDATRRAQRAVAAAESQLRAGAFDSAAALLSTAEQSPLTELQRARIELVRAQIAFQSSHGNEAPALLLGAGRRLEPLDDRLARATYLDALSAAMFAGRLAGSTDVLRVAAAARRLPPAGPTGFEDLLLDALCTRFTDGYRAATPLFQRVLGAFCGDELSVADVLRWSWLVGAIAADLWDDQSWHVVGTRYVQSARDAGALSDLPLALNSHIVSELFAGRLRSAATLIEEAHSIGDAIGSDIVPYGAVWLAAWRGDEREADALGQVTLAEATRRGEGIALTVAHAARAMLANAAGDHERAVVEAQQGDRSPRELAAPNWALTELVEGAARLGLHAVAADALSRLAERTSASGTAWALGVESRARALVSDDEVAEEHYRQSIDALSRTRVRVELARARLLYGEWLRRQQRRQDAREQLRGAHDLLAAMGVDGLADRARRELAATGERLRTRSPATLAQLTGQEAQIAGLAAEGLTNPEIGARLYLSPHTVEWHLRKVFSKLGISSRRQLTSKLDGAARGSRTVSAATPPSGRSSRSSVRPAATDTAGR
jgi:DNA-binding CsgD family transcriptional regulator